MNIVICVKQVPDTETKIKVKDGQVDHAETKYVVNPYDEYAIEEGLRIRERLGEGKITLVSTGPERVKDALKSGLALGADEAIHLVDEAFEGSDPYATALILSKAVAKLDYDIILCGKQGVDEDHAQVGIILAELLDLPHVSVVTKLEISEDRQAVVAHREVEGGHEAVQAPLPSVITAQKGLNEPRYASIKGIMAVKKKVIPEWNATELGVEKNQAGAMAAKMTFLEVTLPPERTAGQVFAEDPVQDAIKVAHLLRDEAKIL
ncbi:MAG TPA: electron transfer flavoprotein subunit beta/FixA family protein [Anaerolineae bacterium]|jgi:electron transfer flavoprotein beta subunit|nr:electron transfer flavoprotein subunit beta/FixA family protein [Anaerolineae bacterium]